jgi:MYXO-CTERM domain-containing protein
VRTHVDPSDDNSPCLFWGRRTVPYKLSARGLVFTRFDDGGTQADDASGANDAGFYALRASLQQWTDVSCSDFAYQDDGFTDSRDTGYNKTLLNQPMLVRDVPPNNGILFRDRTCDGLVPAGDSCADADNDDCGSVYDCWEFASNVIALTTTTYNFQTGEIFDADIELNEAGNHFTTVDAAGPCPLTGPVPGLDCIATDVRNTVTHESGHMLGLGHTPDASATMFPSAGAGETSKRTLAQDDIDGICAIYPIGAPPVTCGDVPQGNSGCGCGAGEGWMALPLTLLVFALRRRKVR